MQRPLSIAAVAAMPLLAGAASAAGLDVHVSDAQGKPVASAVVSLSMPAGAPHGAPPMLPMQAIIDQKFETFFPLVTVLGLGGTIIFRNSDKTMHQVYSFSPPKRFEFEVDVGHSSPPLVFDKAGLVAIGCNIHDQMITYVVVTDNPYTKLSDDTGEIHFDALAAGQYGAEIWHPDLAPGAAPPVETVALAEDHQTLSFVLKLIPRRMTHMGHMAAY
jgi:plastocyanin